MTISLAGLSVLGEILDNVAYHREAPPILGRDDELADLNKHLGLESEPNARSVLPAGAAGVGFGGPQ